VCDFQTDLQFADVFTCDPTPGTYLNGVHPLVIAIVQFVLLHCNLIFFLPECFESVAARIH
jgi:hypothetical protein